ncbi:cobalt-precorrin 3 C17-methyltransferase [Hathewaya proteolytica DSM 3090]|uniref:Cobalt-precorrin 3 C17-methyltransferase n=1 Tax=Hathewaya proteolytica DSM 3090 TaxID=1121331 RepID=A0A1M6Q482_9CLOT|nr:precorrin-3B C(17)-methyltransferase [Hathewaya proteolytica]SHK14971.1 cobalt-precorrin 3 C17-methyltransferase [Hathewaya proteolytica DSM 3090]
MKKLYVIGIGPGGMDYMTIKAQKAIDDSDIVVGYSRYIDMIEPMLKGKEVYETGMKGEEERCRKAIELAEDKIVSVISTGDSGIYGMAGLILQLDNNANVEIIPGVTASCAAASVLGAPLMHDNCNISLSDLLTPYDLIKKRVEAAASADFVISLYNPKSKGRPAYLSECIEIIKKYRDLNTPVGVVKHALREGQEVRIFSLENFDAEVVDMMSIVIIGNSQSYSENGRIITPRGYKVMK